MAARIEIIQWREFMDDEDSLNVRVYADGDDTNPNEEIREEHDLVEPDDAEPDQEGAYMGITEITIYDGEVLEHNDRKFRISITEITGEK